MVRSGSGACDMYMRLVAQISPSPERSRPCFEGARRTGRPPTRDRSAYSPAVKSSMKSIRPCAVLLLLAAIEPAAAHQIETPKGETLGFLRRTLTAAMVLTGRTS
jgi:hypothetical protein